MESKICTKCREPHPLSAFRVLKTGALHPHCRECEREYQREYQSAKRGDKFAKARSDRRRAVTAIIKYIRKFGTEVVREAEEICENARAKS